MNGKLSVAFLWHMHQPLYKDLRTGKYHLPWVRLHSTYSYLDMASAIEEFPEARATFNFTPSLIWQLLDISDDDNIDDEFLRLARTKAEDLTEDETCFVLKNFFSCDMVKAISPIKKYEELFHRRGNDLRKEKLARKIKDFSPQDIRDLQVFFNLAWCGFTLKKNNPVVRAVLQKARDYTEEDKQSLLDVQKDVVASILPRYKKLQEQGIIEISTTPFYHPILPLLCSGPESPRSFDLMEDAKVHVKRAVELYEKVFGVKPEGMWPAEGSVSQDIIPLLVDQGIKWMATDEGILLESFRGEGATREDLIYRAYVAEESGKKIDMVFRDINISNAISFRYASMPVEKSVSDMKADLKGIFNAVKMKRGDHIAAIILDGENPWPYYDDGGCKFLRDMYSMVISSPELEPETIGGFLSKSRDRGSIENLYSGSWINRNFAKWIGSPQKNKAWEYLRKAREDLFAAGSPPADAMEELYIAEGSDWFWWYDDFGTELNFIFDELFRSHLKNLYEIIGRKPPMYLSRPIPSGPSARRAPTATAGEMASYPKILFVSSEVVPYAKTGGLADVSGSLPRAVASMGCDVRVIMPLYKTVTDSNYVIEKEASNLKHPFAIRIKGFDVYSNKLAGSTTYFIRNKKYFSRAALYGTAKGDYPDNALRFAFFSKAVLEALKALDFRPDIIHCNDWQTALIPFYLKFKLSGDPFYSGIKTLFSIHNMAFQGLFSNKVMKKIDIPESFFNMSDLEFYGSVNFMKSGILYSDAISTVSYKYAEEIMTPKYGCGLDGLLRLRKDVLYGIPNGADYSVWSPKKDRSIRTNYGPESLEGKRDCRKELLEYTGLEVGEDKPLFGVVSRLEEQKGVDLIAEVTPRIVQTGSGIVVLGRGREKYNRIFTELAAKYPDKVYYCGDFNDPLAHKIEAGCDIFLMPSRYEPCGLNQIYSIKYGTIPVVRATGGLDDVITDNDEDRENGNGFKFLSARPEDFYGAIERALETFNSRELWRELVERAMACDHSWDSSAKQYLALYREMLGK